MVGKALYKGRMTFAGRIVVSVLVLCILTGCSSSNSGNSTETGSIVSDNTTSAADETRSTDIPAPTKKNEDDASKNQQDQTVNKNVPKRIDAIWQAIYMYAYVYLDDFEVRGVTCDEDPEEENVYHYDFWMSNSLFCATSHDGIVDDDFMISLSKKDNNQRKKEIIALAITALEECDFDEAQKNMKELIKTYDGTNDSDVLVLNKYKYLIQPKMLLEDEEYFYIMPNKPITGFDTSKYPELTSEDMKASFNMGEKGCIIGKVLTSNKDEYTWNLEILNDEGEILIYYNPKKFGGEFEIGKTYRFYGTIAESKKKYSGGLRIDYYEPIDTGASD